MSALDWFEAHPVVVAFLTIAVVLGLCELFVWRKDRKRSKESGR